MVAEHIDGSVVYPGMDTNVQKSMKGRRSPSHEVRKLAQSRAVPDRLTGSSIVSSA
jgi:hypothetical protein